MTLHHLQAGPQLHADTVQTVKSPQRSEAVVEVWWRCGGQRVSYELSMNPLCLPPQIAFSQHNSIMDLVQFFVTFFR